MKFVCLGYMDEKLWDRMPESEQNAFIDKCFDYDDVLRNNGHMVGGEALQGPRSGVTLRHENGEVSVTDGPYAETKEYLGGIMFLEARDTNHAIQLISQHPGVCPGSSFEIRPAADLTEMIEQSNARRKQLTEGKR